MLQSIFRQRYRTSQLAYAFASCAACQCRCGRTLPNLRSQGQQQRRGVKKAPSTTRKTKDRERVPVTPEQIKRHKAWEERQAQRENEDFQTLQKVIYRRFHVLGMKGQFTHGAEEAMKFIAAFASFLFASRNSSPTRSGAASSSHQEVQAPEHGISDIDVATIAWALISDSKHPYFRYVGYEMMMHYSRAGNEYATLWIMGLAYDQDENKPGELQSSALRESRDHLFRMANNRDNQTAMVLAGKIAYMSETTRQYAIGLWNDALEAPEKLELGREAFGRLHEQTSAPYIELTKAYVEDGDFDKAKDAINIGCNQSDPTSHYFAALEEKTMNTTSHGGHEPTSTWLYHISKSAASGYPKAMHELGCYYMTSYWPYLKDEVPDIVKPTPFDQYPPAPGSGTYRNTSVFTKMSAALGLNDPTLGIPEYGVFHSAAVPHTVEDRLRMALAWFEAAQRLYYAPSFLAAAKLYLLKDVYVDMAAPREAIQLHESRYPFTSRADYLARKNDEPPDVSQIRNPLLDSREKEDNKAYDLIREIFSASKAARIRHEYVKTSRGDRDMSHSFIRERENMPESVSKWFIYPDFYPLYMREGIVFDKSTNLMDMLDDANGVKQICDEQGWEVFDPENHSLLYRPKKTGR